MKNPMMILDGGAGALEPTPDTPPQGTPDPNLPDATPKAGDTPPVDQPADEAAIAAEAKRKEDSEKFFQTKYQELLADKQPQAPAAPVAAAPPAPAAPDPDIGVEPTVGDMTEARLAKVIGGVVSKQMTAHEDAALVKYQMGNAMKPINEYAAKEGLSQEDIKAAFEQAQAYGIDITVVDGPTKFAAAAFVNLRNIGLSRGHVAANSEAVRLAEAKARDLAATAQPGGTAPPVPVGEKSENEKTLDRMNELKGKSSSSLLDPNR